MVPALLMEARGDERLLDMCSAPGSKTGQLLEVLAEQQGQASQGLVVANELDEKRAQMLVHQCRRLQTAPLMVTWHAAQSLPEEFDGCFHKVLADVPCTGDGTLRKNKKIWSTWSPLNAMKLHPTQLQILQRAIQMCRPGGRVVYSTCSLNPIEDEAVVAEVLRQASGGVALVDASSLLPELKRRPGITRWAVPRGDKLLWEAPKGDRGSMFAPSKAEAKWMFLDRCVRIYPHLQDTGGFFVAVLQRTDSSPSSDVFASPPLSNASANWDTSTNHMIWYSPLQNYPGCATLMQRYGLPSDLAVSQLLVRNDDAGVIYYVNRSLGRLLLHDPYYSVSHANSGLGVPAFRSSPSGEYHVTHAGLQALVHLLGDAVVVRCTSISLKLILRALRQDSDRHVDRTKLPTKLQRSLESVGLGGAVLVSNKRGVDAVALVVKSRTIRIVASDVELQKLRHQLGLEESGAVAGAGAGDAHDGAAGEAEQGEPVSAENNHFARQGKKKKRRMQADEVVIEKSPGLHVPHKKRKTKA